jgi:hypothetical protein
MIIDKRNNHEHGFWGVVQKIRERAETIVNTEYDVE